MQHISREKQTYTYMMEVLGVYNFDFSNTFADLTYVHITTLLYNN